MVYQYLSVSRQTLDHPPPPHRRRFDKVECRMTLDTHHLDGRLCAASLATGGNALLARMRPADLELIASFSTRQNLPRGLVLAEADEIPDALYFVEHGVASVIAPHPEAHKTEIALIGPETFVGAAIVVGDGRWPYRTFVQVDQLSVVRWPLDAAQKALRGSPDLNSLLNRAVYAQMVQIAEGLVSAAWQRLDARLARWLLMYRDRLRSDRLEVTHEFMAMMVGVQRTGITEALHDLEGAGLIAATRGLVIVRDAEGLRRLAGPGYGVPEQEYGRLFPNRA